MNKKKKNILSNLLPAWLGSVANKFNNFQLVLTLIFVLLSTAFVIAGYVYYKAQVEDIEELTGRHLKFSAASKSAQIKSWLGERKNDAEILFKSSLIARQTQKFIANPTSESDKNLLLEFLNSIYKSDQYESFRIATTIGDIVYSSNEDYQTISPDSKILFDQSLSTGKCVFSGFITGNLGKKIYMNYYVPIFLEKEINEKPIAVIILRIDPNKYFYPIIQADLQIDSNLDFVLARNEGDYFLYLNKISEADSSYLSLKLPPSDKYKHLQNAKKGIDDIVYSTDYKDNTVLTSVNSISDSPWTLITKIDSVNVYKKINSAAKNIAMIIFLFIAMSGVTLGFVWTKSSEIGFKKLYKTEAERRARTQQYVTLLKNANDTIILFDDKGDIYEVNERATYLYGFTSQEFRNHNIRDLVSNSATDGLQKRIEKIVESDGAVYETIHKKRDGTSFNVEISARAIKIDGTEYFQAIVRDITERIETAEKIKNQNEFLQLTINSLTIPFLVIDAHTYEVKLANDSARALGPKSATTCFALTRHLNEPCNSEKVSCTINNIKSTNKPSKVEHVLVGDNGDLQFFEVNAYPIFDKDGKLAEVIEYSIDITERKKQELELIKTRDEAEQANRLKSIFLANMSHELRTPLNGILGFSEIIIEDTDQIEIKDLAKMLNLSAIRLFKTLNLILDLSRIEAGNFLLEYENVSIHKTIKQVFELHRYEGSKKELDMKLSFGTEDLLLKTDLRIFTGIIENLLHNAIKFTHKGFVELKADVDSKNDEIILRVNDSGIGIKKDQLNMIWEEFKQLSEGLSRSYEGSGLGLSLVRKYVRKLNGRIEVDSAYGSGTKFTVYLPIKT